ncbi:MAG: lysylphosphatidylglycerol synthase domain-containing protein [Spongiibacteraceae bacterium]
MHEGTTESVGSAVSARRGGVIRRSFKDPAVRHWLRRVATLVFFFVVTAMLVLLAQRVEWREVAQSLRAFETKNLWLAAVPALASYLVYSTFDLFGRRHTRHKLPRLQVMTIAFVCYAFTQSLTAWVGGIAMRYRLYSRFGVEKGAVAQIFGISILTNWIGYFALASVVCLAGAITPPANWPIGSSAIRIIGALLSVPVIFYLWCCYRYPDQGHRAFGQEWQLPTIRIGLLQLLGGAANWALMSAVIFVLLQQRVDYVTVLGILLLSSVAAVIVHIPAGLGVLEAVFITTLQGELSRHHLFAALICYRAIYYLVPLLLAVFVYVILELQARKRRNR